MRRLAALICLFAAALTLTACQSVVSTIRRDWRYDKPTVAVLGFENRAPFPQAWDLGNGFAEILTTELLEEGRFHVVDRIHLGAILSELALQHSDTTRDEQRAALGRIRNAQCLVRGAVTDFSHVARGGFGIGWGRWRIGGGGHMAVVSMVIQVLDVESSEVLLSERVEGRAYSGEADVAAIYSDVAFAGSAFYQTPLGRATRKTIDRAMDDIIDVIGRQRWRPRLASVDNQSGAVILNGGRNRHVRPGTRHDVLELGPVIVDPTTGDILGREESRVIGVVEVTQVEERFAHGRIVSQDEPLEVGARLDNPVRPPREGWPVTVPP